ncbi:MAG: hypothetical protein IH932_01485 [Thaumarchaeota archaeon]|nr:hypothetical protein [Nitrososphaerota archaeon]
MSVDPEWKGIYKIGGVSFLIAGIAFVIAMTLFLLFRSPSPTETAQYLEFVATERLDRLILQTNTGIFILSGLLFIPGILALYHALKGVGKIPVTIASAILGLAIPIFTVGFLAFSSIFTLSES